MSDVRIVKLGDLCDIVIGRTPARKEQKFWGGDIPWLSITDMNQGTSITRTKEKITEAGARNGKLVPPGTVLFSFKLSIGKVGIAKIPLYTNEAIVSLPIKDTSMILPEYLMRFLEACNFDLQGNRAAMGKTLNKKSLHEIEISVPSIQRQLEIVTILSKVKKIQEARKRQLATLDELLISIFKDSFHAEDYPHKPLKEIATVLSGGTPRSSVQEYWNGNLEWVTPADLGQHEGIYFSSSSRKITDAGLKNSSAVLLPTGSVMMSSRAPIGHLAINTVPMATNQGFKSIVPGEEITNLYLLFWLKSHMSYIQSLGVGATFKEISKKVVENIKVPLPPITEQNRFSQKISKTISQKNLIHKSLEKDKSLFLSIQSSFFNY